jgi:hypothetical protein
VGSRGPRRANAANCGAIRAHSDSTVISDDSGVRCVPTRQAAHRLSLDADSVSGESRCRGAVGCAFCNGSLPASCVSSACSCCPPAAAGDDRAGRASLGCLRRRSSDRVRAEGRSAAGHLSGARSSAGLGECAPTGRALAQGADAGDATRPGLPRRWLSGQ